MVTSAHFSKENKVLLNKSQTPFFLVCPVVKICWKKNFGSHIRQPTIWKDASYLMFQYFILIKFDWIVLWMIAAQAKYLKNWTEEPISRRGWNNTHEHTTAIKSAGQQRTREDDHLINHTPLT